jgi:hypothetical protein
MMFSEQNPKLQVSFDNTSISVYKDCPRKYYYSIIEGWRPNFKAPPLAFGGVYHDCLEVFDKALILGENRESALRNTIRYALKESVSGFGDDSKRTRITLIRSIIWYAEQYKVDPLKTYIFPNGRVGLEMSFSFELPFKSNSGETFEYCGHMDKLAIYNGQLYTVERKHTVQTLSPSFFERYFFSAQIGGYVYAGKVVFDQPVVGAIIEATQVAVNFSRFGRSVVYRVNDHLEEWMKDTHYWIKQIEFSAEHNYWPHNSESCSKYAGCQFRQVCAKPQFARELTLESSFRRDRWDPTKIRGEE